MLLLEGAPQGFEVAGRRVQARVSKGEVEHLVLPDLLLQACPLLEHPAYPGGTLHRFLDLPCNRQDRCPLVRIVL
jgi:hypothetical protein